MIDAERLHDGRWHTPAYARFQRDVSLGLRYFLGLDGGEKQRYPLHIATMPPLLLDVCRAAEEVA
jgi:hypothetical protein